jgi:hypothetical protein
MLMSALVWLIASPLSPAAGFTRGRAVKPFTPEFKPADYVWHPEVLPAGPVVLRPTAAMAWSLTGAAISIVPEANLSRRAITAHPKTRKPSPRFHRILKLYAENH